VSTRLPRLGQRGEGWVAIQLILLGAIGLAGLESGGSWSGTSAAVSVLVGVVLMGGGAVLAAKGLVDLGRNLTPMPHPRDDAQLVESGVYALARHPIYGGLAAAALGSSLAAASLPALLLATVLVAFFELKSRREEAWLRERFAGYASYMSRTKRFIPWLY
jgi:protein-S-isoprenylcysteine O-methyltransferase Ste14